MWKQGSVAIESPALKLSRQMEQVCLDMDSEAIQMTHTSRNTGARKSAHASLSVFIVGVAWASSVDDDTCTARAVRVVIIENMQPIDNLYITPR